ncbi:MAG: alkaline phosphatase family protein [Clostridia bacterium]|nr:alkaline phosphatase family protein [Clostridia bacterium]
MGKHLIVVSIDALVYEDLEYARTLPNFAKIMENASIIERVKTVYPSLTHPVHSAIMTGCPTGKTGIISNMIFDPNDPTARPAPWFNDLSDIKCDTILHAAKRAGLTTAASSWPLTVGGGEVIDYLVPGLMNYYFDGREDNVLEVYREMGASDAVMDIIEEGISHFGYRDEHPDIDRFQIFCASEIIRRYKPNLLLTHPSYVDNRRHATGVFGEGVRLALDETDIMLGSLIAACEDAGIYEETDFILLSDHGHINITRVVSPNVYLKDNGLIEVDDDGDLMSYEAYVSSGGASARVYLSRPEDGELNMRVYNLLMDMAEEGIYGFERVFTKEETERLYGLTGDFSFVLEGDGYTSFGEHLERPSVRGYDLGDYRFGKGTHGHMPEKGPQPVFIASGPSFEKGVIIPEGSILNHAPTMAQVLGVFLPDADGEPVYDIIKP